MKKHTAFAILLLLTNIHQLFAHALWIETEETNKKNTSQEIKVFYGEYNNGIIEKTADWYSDVNELELWLTTPQGKKSLVPYETKENHLFAQFIPKDDGEYILSVSHRAKDLGGDYIYQFNTTAKILVGKSTTNPAISNDVYVTINNKNLKKVGDVIKGTVFIKGKTAPKETTVEVVSPQGWSKEFKTNESGEFEFPSIGKGIYFLEASITEDASGEHHGKKYNHIWRCGTTTLKVVE